MTLLLMTPGPTRVPDRILAAGAMAMIHHRSEAFRELLASTLGRLRPLFGTKGDVLPVHSTGRGALEGSIVNFFSPGDEVLAYCNGLFGEMWAGIAEAFGVTVHRVGCGWEVSADPRQVEEGLAAHPRARALLITHSDTSTGALNDVNAVARVCRSAGVLVMVDAVSSLGGVPFHFDDWGIDITVTASQKCLMSSPGMAFVAVSERAWEAQKAARLPRMYFDFAAIRKALTRHETPGTTPVHLVAQVNAALELIEAEGLENVFARHEEMGRMTRQGTADLGMPPQCPGLEAYSPTVSAIRAPAGIAPLELRQQLKSRGILTAQGLGPYTPTCFRIGHMGDIRPADVNRTLHALAEILASGAPPT
jgi:aspartate aminotransferase-like enzyme